MFVPFRQGSFEELPAKPRLAHPWNEAEKLEIRLPSGPFAGMRVHVRKAGQGPPLLLIHGLMTSSYSWRYTLEPLGRQFTCYAPDLPGAGRSDPRLEPSYEPAVLAEWVGQVQRELGVRGCPVIANSMGGYIAMHLALADPESMSHLVNLHSPGTPDYRLTALKTVLALPGTGPLFRWYVGRSPIRFAHRNAHYYDESLKSLEEAEEYGRPLSNRAGLDAFRKYLAETMDTTPMHGFVAQLRERRGLGEPFPVPLLLVYAEKDPMVPPRVGDELRELIPSAQFVRLSEASHFAHVDAVERFLPPVLAFLAEKPASSRP